MIEPVYLFERLIQYVLNFSIPAARITQVLGHDPQQFGQSRVEGDWARRMAGKTSHGIGKGLNGHVV